MSSRIYCILILLFAATSFLTADSPCGENMEWCKNRCCNKTCTTAYCSSQASCVCMKGYIYEENSGKCVPEAICHVTTTKMPETTTKAAGQASGSMSAKIKNIMHRLHLPHPKVLDDANLQNIGEKMFSIVSHFPIIPTKIASGSFKTAFDSATFVPRNALPAAVTKMLGMVTKVALLPGKSIMAFGKNMFKRVVPERMLKSEAGKGFANLVSNIPEGPRKMMSALRKGVSKLPLAPRKFMLAIKTDIPELPLVPEKVMSTLEKNVPQVVTYIPKNVMSRAMDGVNLYEDGFKHGVDFFKYQVVVCGHSINDMYTDMENRMKQVMNEEKENIDAIANTILLLEDGVHQRIYGVARAILPRLRTLPNYAKSSDYDEILSGKSFAGSIMRVKIRKINVDSAKQNIIQFTEKRRKAMEAMRERILNEMHEHDEEMKQTGERMKHVVNNIMEKTRSSIPWQGFSSIGMRSQS